jgi:hypothetical protein
MSSPTTNLLSKDLEFRHRWIYDPIPPWILSIVDKQVLVQLAGIQLDLQRSIMQAQIKALDATEAALKHVSTK